MQFNIQTLLYSDLLIPYEQIIYQSKPDLGEEQSLELASMLFFDSLNLDLNINDDTQLTQTVKDKLAVLFLNRYFDREIGFETERKFRMKLKSILFSNSDKYNRLFTISFLKFLDGNVSLQKNYKRGRDNNINTTGEAISTGKSDNTSSGKSDNIVDRTTDDTSNQTDKDFNRVINENTPDDRLNITSNAADGSGVISKASSIQENKTTNNQEKSTNQKLTGKESNTNSQTGEANYNSNDEMNSSTVGNEEETYNDDFNGYDFRNVTQGKVYQDYINSVQNVYELIIEDCDKCFLQIWV